MYDDPHVSEIVGREPERTALAGFLASGPGPTALLLEGEAGIGKTTLLRDALAQVAGRRVLACRPAPIETPLSFAAVADLLEGVDLSALPAPQRHALEVALLRVEGTADPRAIGVAVLAVLRDAGPLVLAIDDAQWLDAASRVVLAFALRRLVDEPVLLLISSRGGEWPFGPPPEPLERLAVGPLGRAALHRLLLARLGVSFPRPLVQRIHASSGGNPFYALELARAVERHGPRSDQPLPVSEPLQRLVQERLAESPEPVRRLLELVSAMLDGRVATVRALAEPGALDAAVAAGLLEQAGDRIAFTHPILATGVYADLGPERRRAIHRRLLDATAGDEEHAVHLALGNDEPDAAIAAQLDAASARAFARGAAAAAGRLAECAARLTPADDPAAIGRRTTAAGGYLTVAGHPARARELLTAQIARLPRGPVRAQALSELAWAGVEDLAHAAELLEQALDEGGDGRAHLRLSIVQGIRGRLDAAARHAEAAAEAPGLRAAGLAQSGYLATLRGGGVVDASRRAVELDPTDLMSAVSLGQVLVYTDAFDEAREVLSGVLDRAAGNEEVRGQCLFHLADLERRAGRWELALELSDRTRAHVAQSGNEQEYASCLVVGALLDAGLGRVEAARRVALDGVAAAERMGDATFMVHHRGVAGFVELSLGKPEAAAQWLAPATDALLSQGVGELSIYPAVQFEVDALAELGQRERLAHLAGELDRLPPRPWTRAVAARGRALLLAAGGDLDGARERLLEAARYDAQPFEHARTLLALGRLERRAKRKRAARDALEQAAAIFAALPAPLWEAKAHGELARLGIRGAPGGLTETESRIATLAASGMTNPEIAAAVFVSRKTVEANLSKAYRKLGVRSRVELATRLARGELPN